MIAAALLAVAAAAPTATDPVDVVRVKARPDLPWVTAVVAFAAPVPRAALDKLAAAAAPALSDVGVRIQVEVLGGFDVVAIEGPPEAHDAILRAARAAIAKTGNSAGSAGIFVDGRTKLVDTGGLPSRPAGTNGTNANGANGANGAALAPSPGLVDVEGAALALLVGEVIEGARIERGALVVEVQAKDRDIRRAALEAIVGAPLPPQRVEALRTRARAVVAERRARAGGWARDMATMWLLYGSLDVEEPRDLGSVLRARIFPAVLVR